jgi:alkanesulfonate monooxygenase SsuD/methylene tetrahydromethanopterin reductase-like flavin-dependent oxidoreductase (luciferase family)
MDAGLVILPTGEGTDAVDLWPWAEQAGFATAWTYDHLSWRGLPRGKWFAAYPVLAAAAAVTATIRLGTLVSSPNLRHPIVLAQEARTIDHLSGGRFDLGIGAGSVVSDVALFGGQPWSVRERAERFAEYVELLDRVLTGPLTTWRGRWYEAVDVPANPPCVQQPRLPLTVAASGPKGIALAARFGDRWATHAATADVPGQVERFADACADIGRDAGAVGRVLLEEDPVESVQQYGERAGRASALGFTEYVARFPHVELGLSGDRTLLEEGVAGLA